jgi:hypothetical protein
VEVATNGVKNKEVNGILLKHEGKWERETSFVLNVTGEGQKIKFYHLSI